MVMEQSPPSPRRSTISAFPAPGFRTRKNGGNIQCTHLTMTRLYTNEFRCVLCLNAGSFGWLYRCTQDRELLLDEDMENGFEEKLDKFCELLPKSTSPRKRSAAARLHKLSFLTEVSDDAMKDYTPQQVKNILDQRANLIDQLSQPDYFDPPATFYQNRPLPLPVPSPHPNPPPGLPIPPTSSPSNDNGLKPWFPLQGGECQFKCCHSCRPSLKERSFLSLSGIVDGDVPATSITGFGFHLIKQRPVALVEHVKNLGLRQNPTPRPPPDQDTNDPNHHSSPSSPVLPPKKRVKRRSASLGLGIFASEVAHPSASPSYTAPLTPTSSSLQPSTPTLDTHPSTPILCPTLTPKFIFQSLSTGLPITTPRPTTPLLNSFEHQALSSPPDIGIDNRRHSSYVFSDSPASSDSQLGFLALALTATTPLPPPTPTEQPQSQSQSPDTLSATATPPTPCGCLLTGTVGVAASGNTSTSAPDTDTIMDMDSDIGAGGPHSTAPLTAMKTSQSAPGEISSTPSESKDSAAVHDTDIITQF